jgi:hypothetical protein
VLCVGRVVLCVTESGVGVLTNDVSDEIPNIAFLSSDLISTRDQWFRNGSDLVEESLGSDLTYGEGGG